MNIEHRLLGKMQDLLSSTPEGGTNSSYIFLNFPQTVKKKDRPISIRVDFWYNMKCRKFNCDVKKGYSIMVKV